MDRVRSMDRDGLEAVLADIQEHDAAAFSMPPPDTPALRANCDTGSYLIVMAHVRAAMPTGEVDARLPGEEPCEVPHVHKRNARRLRRASCARRCGRRVRVEGWASLRQPM